ncbi:aminodeoxychorismate lyase [Aliidiomarina sp.]|uniref:aminodeoxychorismate lyase n=1 Tax=Aliidiomarina sp. TaxID=1872439 RepID=UPI003A4DA0E0
MTQQPHTVLINGKANGCIAATDRAFQFGDGCFTTIAVVKGQLQLWPLHWQRLRETCKRLAIVLPNEWQALLQQEAEYLVREARADAAVIKIIISRGSGGRGYAVGNGLSAIRVVTLSEVPAHYQQWRDDGIELAWANLALAQQPALAGLKTLNRLEQVLLKQELLQRDADDLLVCDSRGLVCETIIANIFWRRAGEWFTPQLSHAGIAGVVRQQILQHNEHVHIVDATPQQFLKAEQVFVCNALLGLVPVRKIAASNGFQEREFKETPYPLQLNTTLE